MKKRILAFCMALMLCVPFVGVSSVMAAPGDVVVDYNDLLAEDELAWLNEMAMEIELQTGCAVPILFVDSFVNEDDVFEEAAAAYADFGFGFGDDKTGIMLMIAWDTDSYAFHTNGAAVEFFTDEMFGQLITEMADYYLGGDYYIGFDTYLFAVYEMLIGEYIPSEPEPSFSEIILPGEREGVKPALVLDTTGILTDMNLAFLNAKAKKIAAKFECDVAVLVLDSFEGNDPMEAAADIYDRYNYGFGNGGSGILLVMGGSDGDVAIVSNGQGSYVFSDIAEVELEAEIWADAYYRNYTDAASVYLSMCAHFLRFDEYGESVDPVNDPGDLFETDAISLPPFIEEIMYGNTSSLMMVLAPSVITMLVFAFLGSAL